MDFFGSALGIIAMIVVIVLIVKFIRFLFLNWIISRILSATAAFISLLVTLGGANFWVCVILTALSWCFFIGPVIFDVEYDGTYDVRWDSNYENATITPNKTGGFFFNVIMSIIVVALIYGVFGSESPVVFIVLPLGLLLMNIWITRKFWFPLLIDVINNSKNNNNNNNSNP